MIGFENFSKLQPGDMFTIDGEHFTKIDALWFRSIENAPLGEQMMTAALDAKINNVENDNTPAKPDVDCSAKIITADGEVVTPPSARELTTRVTTPAIPATPAPAPEPEFKSKSEAKRVTALRKARAAKAKKARVTRKVARKKTKIKKH
jgi:hypothetical protein